MPARVESCGCMVRSSQSVIAGTLRSVEVKVDDGPWQRATLDPANTRYSWKLFTWNWQGASPGEHTLVSRATDVNGVVQPTAAELSRKKTFLEDNGQFPRKVRIG